MVDNFWREQEPYDGYMALYAVQLAFVNNGPSSSQLQRNYYLSSAPLNWDVDPSSLVPQYYLTHSGGSSGNDHMPAPAHPHDTGFSQSNSRLPSDSTPPFLENHQPEIQPPYNAFFNHVRSPFSDDPSANNLGLSENVAESYPNEDHPHLVHDNQSESHVNGCLLICKWHDDHGPCNMIINEGEIASHVSSSHLPRPGRAPMKCQWEGCTLKKYICRDTIIRHIRQIHLKIRRRCQS